MNSEEAERHLQLCATLKDTSEKLEELAETLREAVSMYSHVCHAAMIRYKKSEDESYDAYLKEFYEPLQNH